MVQAKLRQQASRVLGRQELLFAPLILLYGGLLVLPIIIVIKMSLANGFESYEKVLSSRIFVRVVENTIVVSVTTTVITVIFGYLLAALLWKTQGWKRLLVLGFVLLPFWTSVLIKNFAWTFLLQDNGVINVILMGIGLTDHPTQLLHNRFAVIVGMVHYLLPYAVFPIFTSMLTIDSRLDNAAKSLGASAASVFWHVTLPLTRQGIYASALLIFIISASFYVTPVILGGPSQMMVSNMVDYYTNSVVDFGAASALSIIILLGASVFIAIYMWLPKEGQHG